MLLCCLISKVLAAQTSSSSCDISLAGQVSVPELCLSAQQAAAQLVSRTVNFSLLDNGSISFEPIPAIRAVTLEVNKESGGLNGWANLANAFVDGVRSGGLPYGTVIIVMCVRIYLCVGYMHSSTNNFVRNILGLSYAKP